MFDSTENLEQPGVPRTFINRVAYKIGGWVGFGLGVVIFIPYFIFVAMRAKLKGEDPRTAILKSRDKLMNSPKS